MEEILYTASEVAELIKCNVGYVHRLRKAGLIRFMKLGQYKVRKQELERFLRDSEGLDLTESEQVRRLEPILDER